MQTAVCGCIRRDVDLSLCFQTLHPKLVLTLCLESEAVGGWIKVHPLRKRT